MKFIGWDIGIKNMSYCLIEKLNITPDDVKSSKNNNELSKITDIFILGNNVYKILKWGVINIVPKVTEKEEEKGEIMLKHRPNISCCCEISKKINGSTLCRKRAVAVKINKNTDGTYFGYCANHLKKSNLAYEDYIEIKADKCQCCILDDNKLDRCKTKAVYVNKDNHFLGYCRKHYNNYIKNIEKEDKKKEDNKKEDKKKEDKKKEDDKKEDKKKEDKKKDENTEKNLDTKVLDEVNRINFLKIIKGKKVSSINLTQLSDALYKELDNIPELLDAHVVLLENQPVLKNPTMKSMQMFLYSYYVIKGYQNNIKNVNTIQCYMASKKLDLIKYVNEDVYRDIKTEIKKVKSQYSKNKKMAIRLTQNLLNTNSVNCQNIDKMFTDSKKKDDLSDSLLMTLHYLERDILSKITIPESFGSPIFERKRKYSKKNDEQNNSDSKENNLNSKENSDSIENPDSKNNNKLDIEIKNKNKIINS